MAREIRMVESGDFASLQIFDGNVVYLFERLRLSRPERAELAAKFAKHLAGELKWRVFSRFVVPPGFPRFVAPMSHHLWYSKEKDELSPLDHFVQQLFGRPMLFLYLGDFLSRLKGISF